MLTIIKKMTCNACLWILVLQINQAASAGDSEALSKGAIIGIIIGVLIVVVAIIIVVFVCLKVKWRHIRRKNKKENVTRTVPQSAKSNIIKDNLVEILPEIPEEDESIRQSFVSVRDESSVIVQSIQSDTSKTQQTTVNCELATDRADEENTDIVKKIITKTNNVSETDDIKNTSHVKVNSKNGEEDLVKDIHINVNNGLIENKQSEVLVTRVIENDNLLRKDIPHLNSTENIFSEYDAAMTYKTESRGISKSDVSINLKGANCGQKEIKPNAFEFTRDDSDVNLKSESKIKAEKEIKARNIKSEGNLTDAVKSKIVKRKSSLISRITSKSFEWNFEYISPYAMSAKQKQERLERKVRMQKRKRKLVKLKREEKEKRLQENTLVFEKWKQQIKDKSRGISKRTETGSFGSGKLKRYRYWYPT
ncbi:reticulocyte-binding protein homolog 2b-like [Mercenaria mercenaria]|uniref:reticulocyte-binding protein homolog 2b-like n=1 Tax=Mercenaria mercenaria TaxID=6596 RepID=UPI00234F79AE|nr:reticulocyte-binding protein homolog 2b-like [Mercenaria mercenaria]